MALWAVLGSPLIIGADVRALPKTDKDLLLNKRVLAVQGTNYSCPRAVVLTLDSAPSSPSCPGHSSSIGYGLLHTASSDGGECSPGQSRRGAARPA